MPLNDLNAAQIVEAAQKHVALIGKFKIGPASSGTWTSQELGNTPSPIPFELGYRDRIKAIGKSGRSIRSFEVVCPADADAGTSPIPLKDSPLGDALLGLATSEREAGGRIFVQLLDALDGLAPFWHPDFDRLLTGGFYFFCSGTSFTRDDKRDQVITDGEIEESVVNVKINQALLAYFRCSPRDETTSRKNLEGVLADHHLRTMLLREADQFRAELIKGQPGVGRIAETLHNRKTDQAQFLQGIKSAELRGVELPVLYDKFREYAEQVEQISRCEPLTALMLWWLFGKVVDSENTQTIGKKVFKLLYEDKESVWKPRLGPDKLQEDQARYQAALQKQYMEYLSGLEPEKGKEKKDDARAILFQMIMAELFAYRDSSWKPSQKFGRADLIRRLVRLFTALAAETIPGVQEAIKAQKDLLDKLRPLYRDFEAAFGKTLTLDQLKSLLAKLPDALQAWGQQFLAANVGLNGEDLGEAFRQQFNEQVGTVQGQNVAQFLAGQGAEMAKEMARIGEVYRRQIESHEAARGQTLNPGGAKTGTDLKAPTATRPGLKEQYLRATNRPGGELRVPEDVGRKFSERPPQNLEIKKEDPRPDGTTEYTLRLPSDHDPASIPISEAKPTTGETTPLQDLARLLEEHAEEMAQADAKLDPVRDSLLATVTGSDDPAKAPARARLRALLLGEFLLAAPGNFSPLGKDQSSLGTVALLEMVEKIGAKGAYEGPSREKLAVGVDPDCGVSDLDFHEIWETSRGESGEKTIEEVVAYWRDIAKRIFRVREFVEDVRSVEDLLAVVKNGGAGARLTWVNDTLAGHLVGDRDELVVWSKIPHVPPPSVIVVTRQAVSSATGSSASVLSENFQALERILASDPEASVFRHARNGMAVENVAGLPIFLLPEALNQVWHLPWIHQKEIPASWFVSRLCGFNSLGRPLGKDYKQYGPLTGQSVANGTPIDTMVGTVLARHWLEPFLNAKAVSYSLAQLWKGGQPEFHAALGQAWAIVKRDFGSDVAKGIECERDKKWSAITASTGCPNGRYALRLTGPGNIPRESKSLKTLFDLLQPKQD